MKKILSILFIMVLLLSSCSSEDTNEETTTKPEESSEKEVANDDEDNEVIETYTVSVNESSEAGELTVEDNTLTFTNLDNSGAPSLEVYLSNSNSNIDDSFFIGEIEGNEDRITYSLSEDVNLEDYSYVVIWCYDYDIVISSYNLK